MKTEKNLITAITVRGYKSICDELRAELRPLTVLAGANSSGKSSVMQPLLLLKQTLESAYDAGPLRLSGPNVRFTSADQLLSSAPGRPGTGSFAVGFETDGGLKVVLTYVKVGGAGFKTGSLDYDVKDAPGRITEGLTHDEIVRMLPGDWKHRHEEVVLPPGVPGYRWVVDQHRGFPAFSLRRETPAGEPVISGPLISCMAPIIPTLEGLIHVPALRGNPERAYAKTTSAGPDFPGTFENYVASVVSHWQATAGEQGRLAELGKGLEHLGLTWKVDATSVDDAHAELRVGRLVHGHRGGPPDMVNLADVGFGVSQVLPVLVALLVARSGQIVYLEQPEIHLHPFAQRRLANIVASAAERGVRVVMETHSALLLREVQTLVAKGDLAADLVKLHWFTRSPDDGITRLSTADLDTHGAYGDWPEDFDEVHLDSEKAYLDAVEGRAGQG